MLTTAQIVGALELLSSDTPCAEGKLPCDAGQLLQELLEVRQQMQLMA
jgi:hypothetical protein